MQVNFVLGLDGFYAERILEIENVMYCDGIPTTYPSYMCSIQINKQNYLEVEYVKRVPCAS